MRGPAYVLLGQPVAVAPVGVDVAEYLNMIVPYLRPVTPEDYARGLAVLPRTGAPHSHVLVPPDVFRCVEWEPGLIVVRFGPDGDISWCGVRSPMAPTPDDHHRDPEAENPQFRLVFDAWDARHDDDHAEWMGFVAGSEETSEACDRALESSRRIEAGVEARLAGDPAALEAWMEAGRRWIAEAAGDGVVIRTP